LRESFALRGGNAEDFLKPIIILFALLMVLASVVVPMSLFHKHAGA
jgi:hypothetical protein